MHKMRAQLVRNRLGVGLKRGSVARRFPPLNSPMAWHKLSRNGKVCGHKCNHESSTPYMCCCSSRCCPQAWLGVTCLVLIS
eukprot:scaffold32044_cov30-Tisochrysis_lutea.AAC.5